MNFGKLPDISGVDWQLPPDHPRTASVLARGLRSLPPQPRIYLGATGWGNKEWVGNYYPPKSKPQDFLHHYSRLFNTIEFNTTHYRIPEQELVERWESEAAEGFAFCPKVPQQISHRARLQAEEATLRFAGVMHGLGAKLGPCFIQLPDHHGPEGLPRLRSFVKTWPSDQGLHWELRHRDWFTADGGPAGEGFDLLEASGHGTVITDVSGRRDVLHMQLTTPSLMLRFVGNGLDPSDYGRSDAWVQRIVQWCGQGLHSAYIFLHQPEMEQVPVFAAYWAEALNKALGLGLNVPRPLPTERGIQGTLF